jgi:hypothetical protein
MIDVNSFIKAQKVMWVKRFLSPDTASWKAMLTLLLEDYLKADTFKCSLDCNEQPKEFPNFYWQILKNWFEIKNITEIIDTPPEVRRQCLWLNENITVNREKLKWNEWIDKGINIIHDILNQKGQFLTVNQIEQKFNYKCDFMKYNTLKDAIPGPWRTLLKTMQIPPEAISFQEAPHINIGKLSKDINIITNNQIYWILVNDIRIESIISDKLQRELGVEEEKCKIVFTMPRVVTNTKIRAFQYKLLYNLIPTNLYLKRIKKSDTEKCNWCQEIDDTSHFFVSCKELIPFWNSFTQWWKGMLEEDINFTIKDVLIGILNNNIKYETINACLLIAKWHIYKNKLNNSSSFFYKYLCELKYYINIEKTIALKNNKLQNYNEKWLRVEEFLT